MKKIKCLDEIESREKKIAFLVAYTALLVICLLTTVVLLLNPRDMWAINAAFAVVFLSAALFAYLSLKQEQQRRRTYSTYLVNAPVDDLKKAAFSPEIDQKSRKAIIAFLNKNHGGWSFNNINNNQKRQKPCSKTEGLPCDKT